MSDSTTTTATPSPVKPVERAPGTLDELSGAPKKSRILGVDATRGLALLGMIAVHVYFQAFTSTDTPPRAWMLAWAVAAGRTATTFILVAGVSLALMTGGRRPVQGRSRAAALASLTVRALLIGSIGLGLGYIDRDVDVILPYYAVLFLLALPLVGLRPRVLACAAGLIAVVVPVLMQAIGGYLHHAAFYGNPTFGSVGHPFDLAVTLLITGVYPALAGMAYLCAGLAIGRLNLASARVAAGLCAGGLALAIGAWVTSWVLLYPMGGLQQLAYTAPGGMDWAKTQQVILRGPDYASSWWDSPWWGYTSWWRLASPAPYSSTPVDLVHTLGAAMALLGAVLLLTRIILVARVLRPVAVAGSMTLTLYSAHVLFVATGLLEDHPSLSYLLQVAAAFVFAVVWRRTRGQGPLEALVAKAAGRARRAVASAGGSGDRPGGRLIAITTTWSG